MRVLALDTTTRAGSAALVVDDRVLEERAGDAGRTHAVRLPGELLAVLEAAGLTIADVDLLAVAVGPGSFTGLRIGIATMQGLAVVTGRRVVALPALEALAHAASGDAPRGTLVAAWMDAHRRDVFSALYRVADAPVFGLARLVEIDPPQVDRPDAILARWSSQHLTPATVVGDGAALYAGLFDAHTTARPQPLLAGTIGRLAVAYAQAGRALEPAAIQPLYIRRPDAEIARDQGRLTVQAAGDSRS